MNFRQRCETPLCNNEAVAFVELPSVGSVFVCELHAPEGAVVTR